MTAKKLIEGMNFVDEKLIQQAESPQKKGAKRVPLFRRRCMAGVIAAVLTIALSVPACAASNGPAYDLLYALAPAAAQKLRPVRMSCEDNGVRMEVQSVCINGDTAEFYISMQALDGVSFNEQVDLFDSYQINTPFDNNGTCERVGFDPKTQTVLFWVQIRNKDGESIIGEKLTFSVRALLTVKNDFKGALPIEYAEQEPEFCLVEPRGYGGERLLEYCTDEKGFSAMVPCMEPVEWTPGVWVTGIGYEQERLHVQIRYENIGETDNNGSIWLRDRQTGELVSEIGSFSFWDETQTDSYEEYLFEGVKLEQLNRYELYGEFTTAEEALRGNWNVTFPIEP